MSKYVNESYIESLKKAGLSDDEEIFVKEIVGDQKFETKEKMNEFLITSLRQELTYFAKRIKPDIVFCNSLNYLGGCGKKVGDKVGSAMGKLGDTLSQNEKTKGPYDKVKSVTKTGINGIKGKLPNLKFLPDAVKNQSEEKESLMNGINECLKQDEINAKGISPTKRIISLCECLKNCGVIAPHET